MIIRSQVAARSSLQFRLGLSSASTGRNSSASLSLASPARVATVRTKRVRSGRGIGDVGAVDTHGSSSVSNQRFKN